MNTPETKLTVETCNGAFSPDPSIIFNNANGEVLRITHDGRMIKGYYLSWEETTQEAAKLLIASFKEQIQKMVDNRLSDDTARFDWIESEAGRNFLNSDLSTNWREWYMHWHGSHTYINRTSLDAAMKEASK
jgi:isopenicillin N synthase-like dioxygenase